MEDNIDDMPVASMQADWKKTLKYVTPGEFVPHLWGTDTPEFLLSNIFASKACIVRKLRIGADFVARVNFQTYENGNRSGIQYIEIPPVRIPQEHRIPIIDCNEFSDLIICFQEDENGALINPAWKTAIKHHYWEGAESSFLYRL